MKYSIMVLTASMSFICCSSLGQVNTQQIQFQDCTYIDFGETDYSTMTEAEKIQAMDNALFDALDNTEECMKSAITSSAQGLASAANSGGENSGTQGQNASAQDLGEESTQAQQNISNNDGTQTGTDTSSLSKKSVGGPAQSGSSGVCDAVYAGLENAQTETQKTHFQNLKNQYGC